MFKSKKTIQAEQNSITREQCIDYIANVDDEEHIKIVKIIEIKRQANEQIAIIEAGSKKAYNEAKKEDKEFDDIDDNLELEGGL